MRLSVVVLGLIGLVLAPAVHAAKKPVAAWQVMRATDPVTRASTCAVVASDYVGKMRFTQTGALYPVVEMNSTYGLLVGVSSGGRFRMPTGDILWAVDDLPHRELRAAENPGAVPPAAPHPSPQGNLEALTAYSIGLSQAMVAPSTMASGPKAREMLAEMLAGRSLLFRSAGTGAQTGLPNYTALMAGQITGKGELKPIPLDVSFRDGLKACGIAESPASAPEAVSTAP